MTPFDVLNYYMCSYDKRGTVASAASGAYFTIGKHENSNGVLAFEAARFKVRQWSRLVSVPGSSVVKSIRTFAHSRARQWSRLVSVPGSSVVETRQR